MGAHQWRLMGHSKLFFSLLLFIYIYIDFYMEEWSVSSSMQIFIDIYYSLVFSCIVNRIYYSLRMFVVHLYQLKWIASFGAFHWWIMVLFCIGFPSSCFVAVRYCSDRHSIFRFIANIKLPHGNFRWMFVYTRFIFLFFFSTECTDSNRLLIIINIFHHRYEHFSLAVYQWTQNQGNYICYLELMR